jgi:membrane-associated phospholipid phosphatase
MVSKILGACACVALSIGLPPSARADVVTDWNATAITVARAAGDPVILRTLAMVHIAIFDAVNSVDYRYREYAVRLPAAGASREAAAAAAAYGILIRRFPSQQTALDAALQASMAAIPDGSAKDAGRTLGDAVAALIHQLRSADGMNPPNNPPYVPGTGPGAYQLTGPPPVNTGAATYLPFAMTSASQFRPNGPPALHTKRYARDLEDVRQLGTSIAALRTPQQDLIANWHIEMGQFQLSRIAREGVIAGSFDLLTSARLFALLNIALADGFIGVFEAKYHFNFWRPVTAIHAADDDGNDETSADSAWTPSLPVPPHPEYPSAHTMISAAGITVLEKFFGKHYAFLATEDVPQIPGVQTRAFDDLQALLEDMKLARIYGGMHFPTAVEEGAKQGKEIGKWVLATVLQPLD